MPRGRNDSVSGQSISTMDRRPSHLTASQMGAGGRRMTLMGAGGRRGTLGARGKRESKPIVLTEEQRKVIARDRFRRAVFKVKAMIRFGLPMRAKQEEKPKSNARYENTYKLEPEKEKEFQPHIAEKAIQQVMLDNLHNYRYSKFSAANFSRAVSTMIIDKMKELEFPRYKYVCNVMIGENKGQSMEIASRCVWNEKVDNSATWTMKTSSFFAVAVVHAVYLD